MIGFPMLLMEIMLQVFVFPLVFRQFAWRVYRRGSTEDILSWYRRDFTIVNKI